MWTPPTLFLKEEVKLIRIDIILPNRIIEKNIKSMSICEHHFVTIDGKCHIGYIPNKKVLGFTVEDPVRTTKIDDKTAIPNGFFNIVLDTTGNPGLTACYVRFPNDSRAKFKSPGVFPKIGTSTDGNTLKGYGLSFGGIRIHNGTDENWSSGCIIYSSERLSDGRIKNDIEHCKALTKLIYDNKITQIVVTNEFQVNAGAKTTT
jgi:hypothetical protein